MKRRQAMETQRRGATVQRVTVTPRTRYVLTAALIHCTDCRMRHTVPVSKADTTGIVCPYCNGASPT